MKEKSEEDTDVEIITDQHGEKIVKINSIIFRGKKNINWKAVEVYLQRYIGEVVEVSDEQIFIDRKFVDEYTGSVYTRKLRGSTAKAKANAVQGILEILRIGIFRQKMENKKKEHKKDAKNGWRYYRARFAVPIYHENTGEILYNIFKCVLIVRCSQNGKMYLYDMQEIKKETSNPLRT